MAWTVGLDYKKSSNIWLLDERSLTHKDREILRIKRRNKYTRQIWAKDIWYTYIIPAKIGYISIYRDIEI